MAESRSRICKVMAAAETGGVYGAGASFAPADDGFITFNNGSPVALDTTMVDVTALKDSMTPEPQLVGRQLQTWSGTVLLAGSGAVGTAPRYTDLLLACGMGDTVVTDTSVTYAPHSVTAGSCAIATDLDGVKYLMNGCYGTFSMSGSAGQAIETTFDMTGLYTDPDDSSPTFSGWEGGTNRAVTMKSSNLNIGSWVTGSDDPLVFKSFTFTRGLTVEEVSDANDATALSALSIVSAAPTLELVVEAKSTVTPGSLDLYEDYQQGTTKAIAFTHDGGAGNIVDFSFPQAQCTGIAIADGEAGRRTWSLSYSLTHDTANQEFSIAFT